MDHKSVLWNLYFLLQDTNSDLTTTAATKFTTPTQIPAKIPSDNFKTPTTKFSGSTDHESMYHVISKYKYDF